MSMVFALVLLGCADDGSACQALATQPESYTTKALCEANQESALDSDVARRSDHPLVVSRCLRRPVAAAGRGRAALAMRD